MRRAFKIRPTTRPLRPPSCVIGNRTEQWRTVFQRTRSLQWMAQSMRPQLPYLTNISRRSPMRPGQLVRPITTEKARLLRRTAWDVATAATLVLVVLPTTLAFMWWMAHEMMERDYPTPHEWSFRSRCYWHTVQALSDRTLTRGRIPDWSVIANALQALLNRLEDRQVDGAGLTALEELDMIQPPSVHVGFDVSTVYDISSMPEPWRRAYFLTLLEAAKTAEAATNMVFDTTTNGLHMSEFVVGPSNPDSVPLPPAAGIPAPLEQNCIPYCPSATSFYTKLLATRGFTDRERIEALIAFGEWLDGSGQHRMAEQEFRQALKIAVDNLQSPNSIVEASSGIIKHNAPYVTSNLLDAAMSLAVHLASTNKAQDALPIFLSTLQAYRSCTTKIRTDEHASQSYSGRIPGEILTAGLRTKLSGLFNSVEYPPPPPSGNEPLQRTGDEHCRSSAAQVYAGEVLFTLSNQKRATALAWVKEAVATASQRVADTSVSMADRQHCNQCIAVALDTWWLMIQQLKFEEPHNNQSAVRPDAKHASSPASALRREELEHWEWAKQNDRAQWDEKLTFEQWKLWSWFPEFVLKSLV